MSYTSNFPFSEPQAVFGVATFNVFGPVESGSNVPKERASKKASERESSARRRRVKLEHVHSGSAVRIKDGGCFAPNLVSERER